MSHESVWSMRKRRRGGRRLACSVAVVLWAVPGYADAPAEKTPERFPVLHVWHEALGEHQQRVTVTPGPSVITVHWPTASAGQAGVAHEGGST